MGLRKTKEKKKMIKLEHCLNVDGLNNKTVLRYEVDGKKVY